MKKDPHKKFQFFKNKLIQILHFKEVSYEETDAFNFKASSWISTGLYLSCFIALPLLYSFFRSVIFQVKPVNDVFASPWDVLGVLFVFLVPLLGIALSFALDWNTMVKQKGWAAYVHFLFGLVAAVLFAVLVKADIVSQDQNNTDVMAFAFLLQILCQFAGSIIIFLTSSQLRKQIWTTLKEVKLDLLTWITVFLVLGYLLTMAFTQITNAISPAANSDNQSSLELLTKTPFGIFAFILGTVFLAPINEEISYRYGTFTITRGKWLGFTASLIYFPAMHIASGGDWENIFLYMGMGVVAPLLFVQSRGNVTYTIGLHMIWNTIAAITFFATKG